MEEILKELKELKESQNRDWKMITFLQERLAKAEKQDNSSELMNKVDKLATSVENILKCQSEMERKIDCLAGETEKSQGYIGCFVESHEVLQTKLDSLNAKIDNFAATNQEMSLMDRKLDQVTSKLDDYGSKLATLKNELEGNNEIIPKMLNEIKDQCNAVEKAVECQKLELVNLKLELETTTINNEAITGEDREITYRCCNSNCHSGFPKNIELEEDGVSVMCLNVECRVVNIVGKLKEGHKWMSMKCNDERHFQQVPMDIMDETFGKCLVCGEEGTLEDKCNVAVDTRNLKVDEGRKRRKTTGSSTYKCYNYNCNYIFPRNLELREDGVSVWCQNQKCLHRNIVGKLKEQHKWMVMYCSEDRHYQQFPLTQKDGEMALCQVCGTEGETFGFRDLTAVCM